MQYWAVDARGLGAGVLVVCPRAQPLPSLWRVMLSRVGWVDLVDRTILTSDVPYY